MKSSNSGLKVLVIILAILLVGALCYIGYNEFFNEDKSEPIKDEKTEVDLINTDVSGLVDAGLIEKQESTYFGGANGKSLIKMEDGKVKVLDPNSYDKYIDASGILGEPKYVSMITSLGGVSTYVVLTSDGDLYTSTVKNTSSNSDIVYGVDTFSKVNTKKVDSIYRLSKKSVNCLYHEKDQSYSVFVLDEDGVLNAYSQNLDDNGEVISASFGKSFDEMFPNLINTCK